MKKVTNTQSCENCQWHEKSIFCGVKNSSLDPIASKKILNFYKKGQTLFIQGNPSFGIYCIKTGKVKISKICHDGKEIIIRISGPGDVIGHQNLHENDQCTTTATVMEDAKICFIDKKELQGLINLEPQIAMNIIHKLSDDVKVFENTNAAMSHKNVRERLAELLLDFKKSYGVFEKGQYKLDIKLTREEMASMIGTANETIIRFISEFKDEGILKQEGKTIFIMNVEKLEKTANL
jgi:CRP-like cAMP-binding protein